MKLHVYNLHYFLDRNYSLQHTWLFALNCMINNILKEFMYMFKNSIFLFISEECCIYAKKCTQKNFNESVFNFVRIFGGLLILLYSNNLILRVTLVDMTNKVFAIWCTECKIDLWVWKDLEIKSRKCTIRFNKVCLRIVGNVLREIELEQNLSNRNVSKAYRCSFTSER